MPTTVHVGDAFVFVLMYALPVVASTQIEPFPAHVAPVPLTPDVGAMALENIHMPLPIEIPASALIAPRVVLTALRFVNAIAAHPSQLWLKIAQPKN